ncbi:hypothetical protein [Magnetovibrio sp.]|uniref:hypothetical protein n=1 Tax=Magnetovibrio sp. TaxID=2024836 RepID=UPI002F930CD6
MAALVGPAHAQDAGPKTLTTPMQFAGALVGAEIMLIEYSKSPCGPLQGRRFGVNEAIAAAKPHLAPSERATLATYVRDNVDRLHREYRRLTGENLRTMQGQGMMLQDACVVLLNVYDTAYRTARDALEASRR